MKEFLFYPLLFIIGALTILSIILAFSNKNLERKLTVSKNEIVKIIKQNETLIEENVTLQDYNDKLLKRIPELEKESEKYQTNLVEKEDELEEIQIHIKALELAILRLRNDRNATNDSSE